MISTWRLYLISLILHRGQEKRKNKKYTKQKRSKTLWKREKVPKKILRIKQENLLKESDWKVLLLYFLRTYNMYINLRNLQQSLHSPTCVWPSNHCVSNLSKRNAPFFSDFVVRDIWNANHIIMFTFSDTGNGLHFIPTFIVAIVAKFKDMCYEIKEKI